MPDLLKCPRARQRDALLWPSSTPDVPEGFTSEKKKALEKGKKIMGNDSKRCQGFLHNWSTNHPAEEPRSNAKDFPLQLDIFSPQPLHCNNTHTHTHTQRKQQLTSAGQASRVGLCVWKSWSLEGVKCEQGEHHADKCNLTALQEKLYI